MEILLLVVLLNLQPLFSYRMSALSPTPTESTRLHD
jgi:hypothetical protein